MPFVYYAHSNHAKFLHKAGRLCYCNNMPHAAVAHAAYFVQNLSIVDAHKNITETCRASVVSIIF